MAANPANLVNESANEANNFGVAIVTLQQIWEVITTSRSDSAATAMTAVNLPARLSSLAYGGQTLYCVSRSPARAEVQKTGKKWRIACTFTNDSNAFAHDATGAPVTDPTNTVKSVEIDYVSQEKATTKAKFHSVTIGPYHEAYDPTIGNVTDFINRLNPSKHLTDPPWLKDSIGPIVNSAGDVRYSTSPKFFRRVQVTKILSSFSEDLRGFLGKINNGEVIIEEVSGVRDTDLDPNDPALKAKHVFPALTLRVEDVIKRNLWINGTLYYQTTIQMLEDEETWIHSEADAGQRFRVFDGQAKPGGGTYTAEDLSAFDPAIEATSYGFENITQNGIAVGDPARLNGYGAPMPTITAAGTGEIRPGDGDTCFVNFSEVDSIVDFGPLEL